MRFILIIGLLLATPALAEEVASKADVATSVVSAADVKSRTVVWDKNGARVGPVIAISAKSDGSIDFVTVIQGEKSVRIGGTTLSMIEGKLTTSLARREVGR